MDASRWHISEGSSGKDFKTEYKSVTLIFIDRVCQKYKLNRFEMNSYILFDQKQAVLVWWYNERPEIVHDL